MTISLLREMSNQHTAHRKFCDVDTSHFWACTGETAALSRGSGKERRRHFNREPK
jgi:hypothetical protein